MSSKTLAWVGLIVGSTVGGYIPALWGDGLFSFSSLILGSLGAIAGIYFGYKLGN